MDPLQNVPAGVLIKAASAIVHAEEGLAEGGEAVDLESFHTLTRDPELMDWLGHMKRAALVPVKRSEG